MNCGRIEIMGRNIETYENGIPGGLLGYMPQVRICTDVPQNTMTKIQVDVLRFL